MEENPIKDSPSILAADIAKFMSRYGRLKGTRRRFKPLVKVLMKLTCIRSKSNVNKIEKELQRSIHEAIIEQESTRQELQVSSSDSDQMISEMEHELRIIYGPMDFRGDEDIYLALEKMQEAGHIDMLRLYAMNHYVDYYKNPFRRKMYGRRKWLEHIHE